PLPWIGYVWNTCKIGHSATLYDGCARASQPVRQLTDWHGLPAHPEFAECSAPSCVLILRCAPPCMHREHAYVRKSILFQTESLYSWPLERATPVTVGWRTPFRTPPGE